MRDFFERNLLFFKDNVWSKVLLFSLTLFLVRLADAVISFWVPNQINSALNDTFLVGIIIGFQSVVGLLADLTFPKILKNANVRRLVVLAIVTSALTSLFLLSSTYKPFIAIFAITMTLWGIYYELISFANYQFMGIYVPINMRSSAWGVNDIFLNLAYFAGPLIAAYLLLKGNILVEVFILASLFVAFVIFSFSKSIHGVEEVNKFEGLNSLTELKHWFTLSKIVWPILIVSFLLGCIDSTFWTVGAIFSEKLVRISDVGAFFLPFYLLPSIPVGLLVAKWGVYKGKKILGEKFLILAGIFLMLMPISANIYWLLFVVFVSSLMLAVCYPLVQAVYTDLVARMGIEKKEMVGLNGSVVNLSFIIWSPIVGFIALKMGYVATFSIVGVVVTLVGVFLIFVTPKKLRLPQGQIQEWENPGRQN